MSEEVIKADIILRGIESEQEIFTLVKGLDPHILITPAPEDAESDFVLDATGVGVQDAIYVLQAMIAFLNEMEVKE